MTQLCELLSDYLADFRHTELLQKCHLKLLENIDSQDLIAELFSRKVIDPRDKDQLQAEVDQTRRNEALLSMLSRKSPQQFESFLDALTATSQNHVVDMILETDPSQGSLQGIY